MEESFVRIFGRFRLFTDELAQDWSEPCGFVANSSVKVHLGPKAEGTHMVVARAERGWAWCGWCRGLVRGLASLVSEVVSELTWFPSPQVHHDTWF